jgi:histone H3/H4
MVKSNKIDNSLIKKNQLIELLNKKGISRINSESLDLIDKIVNDYIVGVLPLLKEEMIINCRKTLQKEDVLKAFSSLKKEKNWDI